MDDLSGDKVCTGHYRLKLRDADRGINTILSDLSCNTHGWLGAVERDRGLRSPCDFLPTNSHAVRSFNPQSDTAAADFEHGHRNPIFADFDLLTGTTRQDQHGIHLPCDGPIDQRHRRIVVNTLCHKPRESHTQFRTLYLYNTYSIPNHPEPGRQLLHYAALRTILDPDSAHSTPELPHQRELQRVLERP